MNYTKYWAPCTWTLFHTLIEKTNNDNQYTINLLKNIIRNICCNLPCPNCTEHAKSFIASDNTFNNINTLHGLKLWLFNFHNKLNVEKNIPKFTIKQLSKYKNYKLVEVIYLWSKYFRIYSTELHTRIQKKSINITKNNTLGIINKNKHLFTMY